MNPARIFPRYRLALLILLMSVLVSACIPFRIEAEWPALSFLDLPNNRLGIVVAYHDRLTMVDASTGTLVRLRNADGEVRLDEQGNPRLWQIDAPEGGPSQFYSSPVQIDDETMLVATNQSRLFRVDISTARLLDAPGLQLPGPVLASPAQSGELIYLGLSDRNLVALGRGDQREQWQLETDRGIWAQPLLHEDVLYVPSLDHNLYAVDAESGAVLWSLDLGGALVGTPVIHEGHLYVGSFNRMLYDISLDGVILAQYETRDWVWDAPALVDGILYFGDISGTVYAVDTRNGLNERWRVPVAGRGIRSTPVVTDEYVIVGSRDQRVYWLNRVDGSTFFFRELAGEILGDMLYFELDTPIQAGEPDDDGRYVVVNTLANQQFLVAYTVSSGRELWTYSR